MENAKRGEAARFLDEQDDRAELGKGRMRNRQRLSDAGGGKQPRRRREGSPRYRGRQRQLRQEFTTGAFAGLEQLGRRRRVKTGAALSRGESATDGSTARGRRIQVAFATVRCSRQSVRRPGAPEGTARAGLTGQKKNDQAKKQKSSSDKGQRPVHSPAIIRKNEKRLKSHKRISETVISTVLAAPRPS